MEAKQVIVGLVCLAAAACSQETPHHFTHDVMNRMTPVKNQGQSQTCWAYAMLAAIETEHIMRGDSVNLSAAYVEAMLSREPQAPASKRGMGQTLLNMIGKYGIVAYDAMRTPEWPLPRRVFMYGAEYTPLEFAHSVCAPGEYVCLTSDGRQPYYRQITIDTPDNWEGNRFHNLPIDTLLTLTEQAVSAGRGVSWESKSHAMAIVGLAHDEHQQPYFVMKNSWGTDRPHGGLEYLSYRKFRRLTLAVILPRDFVGQHLAHPLQE